VLTQSAGTGVAEEFRAKTQRRKGRKVVVRNPVVFNLFSVIKAKKSMTENE
jgi:hypothetical protein